MVKEEVVVVAVVVVLAALALALAVFVELSCTSCSRLAAGESCSFSKFFFFANGEGRSTKASNGRSCSEF